MEGVKIMKKVKSVAFNIADPMEYALYQYANKHKYFSTYVKRLIQRDRVTQMTP